MFTTKLSLRVKFLEMLLISKDNNVAKLKRKCNWDAGFNSSMIQDLCIKLIYLRNREQKDLEITHISRFSSCSIPLWRLFFFFNTSSYSQFSLYFCNSSSLCQSFSYFFTSSCAYALFSEDYKLH